MSPFGWTEAELISRLKNDSGKLAMAARVRKETTLPIKWIAARLQWAPQKASNISRFIGDTPMRMPTAAHDAHNSSSNLRLAQLRLAKTDSYNENAGSGQPAEIV